MLEIQNLSCGYQMGKQKNKVVLEQFSMEVAQGQIWCILGCNGVGKTTLFRTILGALPKLGGQIRLNGTEVSKMTKKELAREIAYVPQYHTPPFPFSVKEIVLMGRNAYIDAFGSPKEEDFHIAAQVMDALGIRHLENEVYTQISGGERQMVLIARAMAQQPKLLLMDEPASNLDFGNQIHMLRQMQQLSERGISIIFTSHHPDHAFLCNAYVAAIKSKNETEQGLASEIISEQLLLEMYGIKAKILEGENEQKERGKTILSFL